MTNDFLAMKFCCCLGGVGRGALMVSIYGRLYYPVNCSFPNCVFQSLFPKSVFCKSMFSSVVSKVQLLKKYFKKIPLFLICHIADLARYIYQLLLFTSYWFLGSTFGWGGVKRAQICSPQSLPSYLIYQSFASLFFIKYFVFQYNS